MLPRSRQQQTWPPRESRQGALSPHVDHEHHIFFRCLYTSCCRCCCRAEYHSTTCSVCVITRSVYLLIIIITHRVVVTILHCFYQPARPCVCLYSAYVTHSFAQLLVTKTALPSTFTCKRHTVADLLAFTAIFCSAFNASNPCSQPIRALAFFAPAVIGPNQALRWLRRLRNANVYHGRCQTFCNIRAGFVSCQDRATSSVCLRQ